MAKIMRRSATSKTARLALAAAVHDRWVEGLLRDKTRPFPRLTTEVEQLVVTRILLDPPDETAHRTASAMSKESGISISSVQRILRRHGLQPRRMRQFKLSNDPQFAAKLHEIVGLSVDSLAHVAVLSIDESASTGCSIAPSPVCR